MTDIHKKTAAQLFDVPEEKVSPAQRRMAATVNFAALYGDGGPRLREIRSKAKFQRFDAISLHAAAVQDNAARTTQEVEKKTDVSEDGFSST